MVCRAAPMAPSLLSGLLPAKDWPGD